MIIRISLLVAKQVGSVAQNNTVSLEVDPTLKFDITVGLGEPTTIENPWHCHLSPAGLISSSDRGIDSAVKCYSEVVHFVFDIFFQLSSVGENT